MILNIFNLLSYLCADMNDLSVIHDKFDKAWRSENTTIIVGPK